MVERMNDKIRFKDKDELKQSIMKYIYNYNYHIKGINRKTPMEAIEMWFNQKSELFKIDIKTFKESSTNIYNYREGLDK